MLSAESFVALGTANSVVVEDARALEEAVAIVRAMLADVDTACSRFRADSELTRLNRAPAGSAFAMSPLLEEAIVAALDTAVMTDGLVDLTVGRHVEHIGYTVTFRDLPLDGPALELCVEAPAAWLSLDYDPGAHTLRLPPGVSIDLGASGKAWAADRAAATVASRLGVAVAVDCGGDIAVRGAPERGWPIRVAASEIAADFEDVAVFDGGLATSGVMARRWRRGGVDLHHIIDPATGLPAKTPWSMVSVAAATCVEANAAATAALIMGERAVGWLSGLALPARLVSSDGTVTHTRAWRVAA